MTVEGPYDDAGYLVSDVIATYTGQVVEVHNRAACAGEWCCVHNPSDHALADRPLHWRGDRSIMERICDHGIGHPDPDSLDYVHRTRGPKIAWGESVHGCDGCCRGPRREESK